MSMQQQLERPVVQPGDAAMQFLPVFGPEGLQQRATLGGRPKVLHRTLEELLQPCNSLHGP